MCTISKFAWKYAIINWKWKMIIYFLSSSVASWITILFFYDILLSFFFIIILKSFYDILWRCQNFTLSQSKICLWQRIEYIDFIYMDEFGKQLVIFFFLWINWNLARFLFVTFFLFKIFTFLWRELVISLV